jgi:hypothetical protein
LSYSTLMHLAAGGKTKAQSNAEGCWLSDAKVDVVITFIGEIVNQGFPLSHRQLKEHVDSICQARLGDLFPVGGVGKNWTDRFMEKHSEAIKMLWSQPLETKRGQAINSFMKEAFYELLGDTVTKYDINEDWTRGVDEIGIQGSMGMPERVMWAHKLGPQYQQRDGDWENITVLETICANGTSIPPAVIYKGSTYQVKWAQDNPADGKISVEWIKHFDKHTATKAASGKYRLLLIDGHNSHYTHGFLEYACMHQILVVCHPAHTTHVLQGLDVVIFGVLKHFWTIDRDRHKCKTGGKVDKTNFLGIYGRAHLHMMNPNTICAAFQKTGIWPLDPSIITEAMMAPSKETSCEGHLPVKPTSPVKVIAKLLQDLTISNPDNRDDGEGAPAEIPNNPDNELLPADTTVSMQVAVSTAMQQLTTTRLAYIPLTAVISISTPVRHN